MHVPANLSDRRLACRWLALGKRALPHTIKLQGTPFSHAKTFKNDFFAVTALYEGGGRKVVLKAHRQARFFLVPLRWLGRLSVRRECTALVGAEGIEGVPRLLGRWEDTGLIREYIEGHALQKGEAVADDFHSRLARAVGEIHQRNMAYVDLEKCENVIVGDDGRPYLIDFQIAWHWSARRGGNLWPIRVFRTWLQRSDRYHLLKLQRRTRPDQMTPEQLAASYRRPWYVQLHRTLSFPFLWIRRKVMRRVDPLHRGGERGRMAG